MAVLGRLGQPVRGSYSATDRRPGLHRTTVDDAPMPTGSTLNMLNMLVAKYLREYLQNPTRAAIGSRSHILSPLPTRTYTHLPMAMAARCPTRVTAMSLPAALPTTHMAGRARLPSTLRVRTAAVRPVAAAARPVASKATASAAIDSCRAGRQPQEQKQQHQAVLDRAAAQPQLLALGASLPLVSSPALADELQQASTEAAGLTPAGWALALSPIVFYALFSLYRTQIDPRAKFGDAVFAFAGGWPQRCRAGSLGQT